MFRCNLNIMDFNKKNINFKNIVKKNDFYDIENN